MASTPFDDLDESSVLTPEDIADRLRVDARSVRRAIARGELPASRTCGLRVLAAVRAAGRLGDRDVHGALVGVGRDEARRSFDAVEDALDFQARRGRAGRVRTD